MKRSCCPAAAAVRRGAALGDSVRLDGGGQPAARRRRRSGHRLAVSGRPVQPGEFRRRLDLGPFPALVPQHDPAVRRHPRGAMRHRSASPATPSRGCASAVATRCSTLFLLQLMLVPPILIVPNMTTLVALHLYDTLPGVMAPYFASAFGVFLMRQTFRTIPRDYEEAALVDGASRAARSSSACCCRWRGPDWSRSRSSRSPRTGTSSSGR